MLYKINNQYITFTIDKQFIYKSIEDVFEYFHLSKKTIHLLKQNKDYSLNNSFVSSNTILQKNDRLTIKAFEQNDYMYTPTESNIDIIYEDDFLLIINKPAYLPIYPDSQEKVQSLNHYVSYYYEFSGYNIPVRPIHRLDNDTTGLVIYCKCALLQPLLDYQLSQKQIKRAYKAVVEGHLDKKEHILKTNTARDRHNSKKMRVSKEGKETITRYKLIRNYEEYALVECQLETGRKHQIRVHMSYIGHPLLGDQLYGKKSKKIKRQALHAYLIEMLHPITLEPLSIECLPPIDIQSLLI